MAQLVGCWTYNPRVVGSIPSDANCFMWDNILGLLLASAPCMAAIGKVTKASYPCWGNTV